MFQLSINEWSTKTLCSRRLGVYGFVGSEHELRKKLEESGYVLDEDLTYKKIDGPLVIRVTVESLAEFPFAAAAIGAM